MNFSQAIQVGGSMFSGLRGESLSAFDTGACRQRKTGSRKEGRQGTLSPSAGGIRQLTWGPAASPMLRAVGGEVWLLGAHQGKPQGGKL